MGLYDLCDRLNWVQACRFLQCSKSAFFRDVKRGLIPSYGVGTRNRFYLKSDLRRYLEKKTAES